MRELSGVIEDSGQRMGHVELQLWKGCTHWL